MGDSDPIRTLLASARTIAVVGCSADPERDSHHVAAYLQRAGYRVIPVNPAVEELLGERCYPDLAAIPDDVAIDIVDVFRRPEHVPPIAEQAIALGARALWLQLGVSHPEAERRAAEAGLQVVSNRCMAVEHRLRFGG
ncbi:MAG TPA: CoA-binding protein [Thermoanaerobaculales bacterium]|nr:CoA-binding protein [Thermoanaerobaculales bacterium]